MIGRKAIALRMLVILSAICLLSFPAFADHPWDIDAGDTGLGLNGSRSDDASKTVIKEQSPPSASAASGFGSDLWSETTRFVISYFFGYYQPEYKSMFRADPVKRTR
jgi:hypothetical protein